MKMLTLHKVATKREKEIELIGKEGGQELKRISKRLFVPLFSCERKREKERERQRKRGERERKRERKENPPSIFFTA